MPELHRQLRMIRDLQRRLLPSDLPHAEGWSLAVHHAPGPWPGSDFYDILRLPDGRLLIFIADASDQGAPSTALAAMVRVVLHSCPLSSGVERLPFCPLHETVIQPPHIVLGHLNKVLKENALEEQFLTALCGVLDTVDGNFHFANASHPAPLWWHASSGTVDTVRDAIGLPLGLDPRASYHHRRIQLEARDLLVLHTDGLTGSLDESGRRFGDARLEEVVKRSARSGADGVKDAVVDAFHEFLDAIIAPDDVTLLVLEREE